MRRAALVLLAALALAPSAGAAAHARFSVTLRGSLQASWIDVSNVVADGCTFVVGTAGTVDVELRSRVAGQMSFFRRGGVVRASGVHLDPIVGTIDSEPLPISVPVDCKDSFLFNDVLDLRHERLRNEAIVWLSRPARGLVVALWDVDDVPWAPEAFRRPAVPIGRAVGRISKRRLFDRRALTIVVNARYDDVLWAREGHWGQLAEHIRWTLTLRRLAR